MAREEDWKSWCSMIRSTVLTSKNALTPREINRDMYTLEGKNIPWRSFGYSSLEDMLKDVPLLKIDCVGGELKVRVSATKETAHIQAMVSKQKTVKKKSRALPQRYNTQRYSYPNRFNTSTSNSRAPKKWDKPNYEYNNKPTNPVMQSRVVPPKQPLSSTQVQHKNVHFETHTKTYQTTPAEARMTSPKPQQTTPVQARVTPPKPQQTTPVQARITPPKPQQTSVQQRLNTKEPTLHSQSLLGPALLPTASLSQNLPGHTPGRPFNATARGPSTVDTSEGQLAQRLKAARSSQSNGSDSAVAARSLQMNQKVNPVSHSPTLSGQLSLVQQRLDSARSLQTNKDADPRLNLLNYTKRKNLPDPVYKDLTSKEKSIYSSVTVNDKKYSSYPQVAKCKEEAEKLAATKALDKLLQEESFLTITHDSQKIKERIVDIVRDHPNGLFESNVLRSYESTYQESLPTNWLKLVEDKVTCEVGANNITILTPPSATMTVSSRQNRPTSPALFKAPESVEINDMDEFWMRIYVVFNTNEFFGVIIDENHSDRVDDLAREMKIFYEFNNSPPSKVEEGNYFAVFDSTWHRVKCVKVTNGRASVLFIDRGDEDEVSISDLRSLDAKFCKLPAQSVGLSLYGFEHFKNCRIAAEILDEMLTDKDVYISNKGVSDNGNVSVELYMAGDREEENVKVNEVFKLELFEKLNPAAVIKKDKSKISHKVRFAYIGENEVFVNIEGIGLNFLESQMRSLSEEFLNNPNFKNPEVLKIELDKMCVTKYEESWHRVQVTKIINSNLAEVMFVDSGETTKVHRLSLVLLESLSTVLVDYPAQAIKVALHKIAKVDFDKNMATRLKNLASKSHLIMKIVGEHENVPVVEIFKRTEDNLLASLNDNLAEREILPRDDYNNNYNDKPRVRSDRSILISRSSSQQFPLKPPLELKKGKQFDVTIPIAAHPGNFTVQPRGNINLYAIMEDLSKHCNSYKGPALKPGSLKVGSLCAAKYDDGRWYRAYVSKIINANMYAVYFCDYGDYQAVSLEQLQELDNQFVELPYQAIKAKLSGVAPKSKADWSVTDSLRFNELVVNKSFVAEIASIEADGSAQSNAETILGLKLIDTSHPHIDIDIAEILIKENRAEELPNRG